MSIGSFFKKVAQFFAKLVGRAGWDKFVTQHLELAIGLLTELSIGQNGAPLHTYKQKAFELLKAQTGQVRDNWLELLISVGYEHLKALEEKQAAAQTK